MGTESDKPDFSNVQGGVTSTAPVATQAGAGVAGVQKADFSNIESGVSSTADQSYTVLAGDNLSKIAKHFYGNPNEWKRIFEANGDQLSDPDRIRPGQVLKIPPQA
jgi:nucleoid-associated protein YgaU